MGERLLEDLASDGKAAQRLASVKGMGATYTGTENADEDGHGDTSGLEEGVDAWGGNSIRGQRHKEEASRSRPGSRGSGSRASEGKIGSVMPGVFITGGPAAGGGLAEGTRPVHGQGTTAGMEAEHLLPPSPMQMQMQPAHGIDGGTAGHGVGVTRLPEIGHASHQAGARTGAPRGILFR